MIEERILITVRTYPNISAKYTETVCTGGINDRGEWRRLYPVPLRYLEENQQYRTYDIIRVKLRPGKDGRSETFRPDNQSIQVLGHLDSIDSRHQWIAPTIFRSLKELVDKGRSLGPVRVQKVLDFIAEPIDPAWSAVELEKLRQENLFVDRKPLEKVPYHFRFLWRDGSGVEHTSRFIAWEAYQTWRNWSRTYDDVVERMRAKWLNELLAPDRDVAFFMGNLASRRNTFMVCGTYQPPRISTDEQLF